MMKWQKYVWWGGVVVFGIFQIAWTATGVVPGWWGIGLQWGELIIAALVGQPWKKPEGPTPPTP